MRTDAGQVAVITKMVQIIDALTQGTATTGKYDTVPRAGSELNITELSRQVDLPRTTVYRILQTLVKNGVLTSDFHPGLRLIRWAHQSLQDSDLRSASKGVLQDLVQRYRETASVFVRIGASRICIECEEGLELLRHQVSIGDPMPLHAGSAGRILLAWLADGERDALWAESIASLGRPLEQELPDWTSIRVQGWTFSHGERDAALASVSVPIFDFTGQVVAALSVSGPRIRLSESFMQTMVGHLQESAEAIQLQMNATGQRATFTGERSR